MSAMVALVNFCYANIQKIFVNLCVIGDCNRFIMNSMNESTSKKDNSLKQSLLIVCLTIVLLLLQKNRCVFFTFIIAGILISFLCIALHNYQSHPQAKPWAKTIWTKLEKYYNCLIKPVRGDLHCAGIQFMIVSCLVLLWCFILLVFLSWRPFANDSINLFATYVLLSFFPILVTDDLFEGLLNKYLNKIGVIYKANVTRRLIYIVYCVLFVAGTYKTLLTIGKCGCENPNIWLYVVSPAFVTFIAYERAFR